MHCPHCLKPISELIGHCVHCGKAVRAGAVRSRSVIECPRCKCEAELVSLGPVDIDWCATCGNMWFDTAELERACSAADGVAGADLRDAVRALMPSRSAEIGAAVVECPFCPTLLVRRSHPTVPGVVAHVCSTHGAWLERLSLLRLIDGIERAGLSGLRARDEAWETQRAERNKTAVGELRHLEALRARHLWIWLL